MTQTSADTEGVSKPEEATGSTYDDVPYLIKAFPQTHPGRLHVLGRLFDMQPAPVETCRVLELGCAQGGNLLPMAEQLPGAEFVGVDASGKQIETGRRLAERVGLENVRLEHSDILEFQAEQKFDYVICHGTYSWVPPEVQSRILAICRENLREQGIGYVSYNTLPGWRMRGMLRDMMLYHASGIEDPKQKVDQAASLIAFLAEAVPTEDNPYGKFLKNELELIRNQKRSYFLHEFLEDHNQPCYFHEFAEALERHGLQYLGEAEFQMMLANNFSEQVFEKLKKARHSIVATEQYMDFLRNRMFRQTLVTHQERTLNRSIDPRKVREFALASSLTPRDPDLDVSGRGAANFDGPRESSAVMYEPLVKAFFKYLADQRPRLVPFEEALRVAGERTSRSEPPGEGEVAQLCTYLMRCYGKGLMELAAHAPRLVREPGHCPRVGKLARLQAQIGLDVVSQRHATGQFDAVFRKLIALCDGEHGRDDLLEGLVQAVTRREIALYIDQEPITDEQRIREILGQRLETMLGRLAGSGYLLA